MSVLLLAASVLGTALIGGALLCASTGARDGAIPGGVALRIGIAYPLGLLVAAAWMRLLGAVHVPWSPAIVLLPPAALAGVLLWRARAGFTRPALVALARRIGDGDAGGQRWLWLGLLAWLALRLLLLMGEALARPPLPWEAWLHAAGHAHVWHAQGGPVPFVTEPLWWTGGGWLEGLAGASPLTPLIDAWTLAAMGVFDDTVIHAPWVLLWFSQAFIAYGAMRGAGATRMASLATGALITTLPLPNAHAALGGTAALPLATWYLAAFAGAYRWSQSHDRRHAALVVIGIAGMLASGGASGALWVLTLLPFTVSRLHPARMRKAVAGCVLMAALGAVVLARQDLFGPPNAAEVSPGLAALAQHAFLLGNWHLLAYAALAVAIGCWRDWRTTELLPASGVTALGLLAIIVFTHSSMGRTMLGATGGIGHAATAWAPVLALWTALTAHAWYARTAVTEVATEGSHASEFGGTPAANAGEASVPSTSSDLAG